MSENFRSEARVQTIRVDSELINEVEEYLVIARTKEGLLIRCSTEVWSWGAAKKFLVMMDEMERVRTRAEETES